MKMHTLKGYIVLATILAPMLASAAFAETWLSPKPPEVTNAAKVGDGQAVSIPASPGPGSVTPERAPPSSEQMDKNHDDYIDSSEAGELPGLLGEFDTADRDKDGRLDRAEFQQALRQLEQKNRRRVP